MTSAVWNSSTERGEGGEKKVWKGLYIFVSCLPPALSSNWLCHSGLEHAVFASTSCFFGAPGVSERNPSTPLAVVTGRKAATTAGDLLR